MGERVLQPDHIVKHLHGAFCRDVERKGLLQIAAQSIADAGPPYTSVYMYMLNSSGKELTLEAYVGRDTDHHTIPVGRGLCGKAVTEGHDLNIKDVSQESTYLTCNLQTKSELIVLIRRHDEILGQIDVDSDVPNGFDDREQDAVRTVADALAALL